MDIGKAQAVIVWPIPRLVRTLRGFLGLAGCYRKFILNFGSIGAPLTQLLKKEGFSWSPDAEAAFFQLKDALTMTTVLGLFSNKEKLQ
jgi:hypothetical protein